MSQQATKPAFTLTSPDIKEGQPIAATHIYNGFGSSGDNVSPALSWSGAPEGAKSFALTLYDPDAPTGSGFWHWVMFDIPVSVTHLPRGAGVVDSAAAPKGAVQSRTDFGVPGYGGPCPPKGDAPHRYQFTIFALDVETLGPDAQSSGALVGFNLHFHTLARATLTGLYGH